MTVTLVQHTAHANGAPTQPCLAAVRELLRHVDSEVVQRHLRVGVTTIRAVRRQGVSALTAAQDESRRRIRGLPLAQTSFDDRLLSDRLQVNRRLEVNRFGCHNNVAEFVVLSER